MAKPSKFPNHPGVIERKKASGIKLYYRFKAGGEKALPDDMDSEEFAATYESFRQLDRGEATAPKPKEKTFNDAWLAYQASDHFIALDGKTKSRHVYYATTFLDAPIVEGKSNTFKEVPLKSPEDELLPLLRRYVKNAPADLPYRTAGLLRRLYEVAIEQQWVLRNLGNDIEVAKPKSKGGRKQWTPDMLARFERFHQANGMALAAYGLARFLGNRRGDVALLRWDQLVIIDTIVDGKVEEQWNFDFRQRKNMNRTGGSEMFLPVPDDLRRVLELPELVESRRLGGAIVKNEWRQGFTINSIGNKFRDWCDAAGIPQGYTLHGLRANFADELSGAGVDIYTLMDAMGHTSPTTTAIYLKGRNRQNAASKIRAAREQQQQNAAQVIEFRKKG